MGELFTKLMFFLLDVLLYVPKKVFQWLTEACAAMVEAIPVPEFMYSSATVFSNIPSEVWFFAEVAQFDVGVPIIISAYVGRFALRRIPFIGG